VSTPLSYWVGFHLLLAVMLAVELLCSRGREDTMPMPQAAVWSLLWVLVAAAFGCFVWRAMGATPATQFAAGYVLEESMSIDNLFVFLLLFGAFKILPERRRSVLSTAGAL